MWFAGWSGRRVILLSTLGAALLAACCFAPRYWLWPVAGLPLGEMVALQPEFHRAFHTLHQLQDPWQRIDDPVNRVIEWRLLWPVIGHALGLPKAFYLALPHLGCLLALAAIASVVWRVTQDARPTLAAAVLAATSSWFFVATGWLAYFDSWLMLALVMASFGRSRWLLFGAALLAPWIDERFILALPLGFAVRALGSDRPQSPTRGELLRDGAALLAGIMPYLATRLGAEWLGTRATSGAYWADRPLLPAPFFAMVWGAWNGLRLGWIVLALGALAAWRTGRHVGAWLVIVATVVANLLVADDVSRSAAVALPALLAALLLAWRHRPTEARRLLPLLAAGNLLLPAQHVIAAPGTREQFHCLPILSLHAEFERTRNPPDFANPATYVRRSMDHLQRGAQDRALAAAEIALHLDPAAPKALANRGILLFVAGRHAEGLALLDRALAKAPELFDARIQRAAFRQQTGDRAGALDDVRLALRTMPPDWPRRKEAEAFEQALARPVSR